MPVAYSEIPILSVMGSPSEMGEQHGLALAKQISELIRIRTALLQKRTGCSLSYLKSITQKAWKNICSSIPLIAEEIEATAFSADVEEWQLIIAGGFSDIIDILHSHIELASECTVGILPKSSQIFGTWDSHYDAINYALVLRRIPENGVSTLSLTTAGWPIQFGVNSKGLAFGVTNLTPVKTNPQGIPYIAAVAKIATLNSIKESKMWLESQAFMSGHSYILMDSRETIILETTAETTSTRRYIEPFVQTNHYTSKIDDNSKYMYLQGSKNRQLELAVDITRFTLPNDFLSWLKIHPNVLRTTNKRSTIASCAIYAIDVIQKCIWVARADNLKHGLKKISIHSDY